MNGFGCFLLRRIDGHKPPQQMFMMKESTSYARSDIATGLSTSISPGINRGELWTDGAGSIKKALAEKTKQESLETV
jgi:hypothetical protein